MKTYVSEESSTWVESSSIRASLIFDSIVKQVNYGIEKYLSIYQELLSSIFSCHEEAPCVVPV